MRTSFAELPDLSTAFTVPMRPMSRSQSMILSTLTLLLTLAVPVVIVLLSVRLVMSPAFLYFEYHRPGFPVDAYGITLEERLTYGPLAIEYLLNDEGIEWLAAQQFADGTSLYTPLELQHMQDVKIVTRTAFNLLVLLLTGTAACALLLLNPRTNAIQRRAFWQGIYNGGLLTLGLIVTVVLGAIFAWDYFFVSFHRLFFADGTWVFLYSDTLIRLFPERFWFDAALLIGLLTAAASVILILFSWINVTRAFQNP